MGYNTMNYLMTSITLFLNSQMRSCMRQKAEWQAVLEFRVYMPKPARCFLASPSIKICSAVQLQERQDFYSRTPFTAVCARRSALPGIHCIADPRRRLHASAGRASLIKESVLPSCQSQRISHYMRWRSWGELAWKVRQMRLEKPYKFLENRKCLTRIQVDQVIKCIQYCPP